MRTDPSENGGLFVGRRPGTAPIHYRDTPERKGEKRQRVDGSVAGTLFAGMVFVSILCWGPIPVACLWIGSQVNYLTGSVSLGILVAFASLFALLFGALSLLKRMDNAWILVRRAAGCDQRSEEHTSELQSRQYLVCRLLLEKTTKRRTTSGVSPSSPAQKPRRDHRGPPGWCRPRWRAPECPPWPLARPPPVFSPRSPEREAC